MTAGFIIAGTMTALPATAGGGQEQEQIANPSYSTPGTAPTTPPTPGDYRGRDDGSTAEPWNGNEEAPQPGVGD